MKLHLVDSNVMVLANQFNPSVFSQLWLTKHGLATEEEVEGSDCVFTNVFVQLITPRFALVVTPTNMQLMVKDCVEDQQKFVEDKIAKVVELAHLYLAADSSSENRDGVRWALAVVQRDTAAVRAIVARRAPLSAMAIATISEAPVLVGQGIDAAQLLLDRPATSDSPNAPFFAPFLVALPLTAVCLASSKISADTARSRAASRAWSMYASIARATGGSR